MQEPMSRRIRLGWDNFLKYIPLLKVLVERDLKKKYRTSVLGYIWCVLNPLLVMLIMTLVFTYMFRNQIENFPVYVFIGRMMYTLLSGGPGTVMRSLVSNGGLMRKTRVPYYVFPLSSFFCVFVDFLFNLAAFAIVLIFTQAKITIHIVAFPIVILEAMLMTFGLSLLLSIAHVFIRDVGYIWGVFCTAWMYLSAIFYPLSSLPEMVQRLISFYNPLYWLIDQTRTIFLLNAWPRYGNVLKGFGVGGLIFILALLAYQSSKDDLILYV